MAKLTAKARSALPPDDFALPGGKYPIPDKGHAKAALGRAKTNATPAQQATVKAKVATKFPGMALAGVPKPMPMRGKAAAIAKAKQAQLAQERMGGKPAPRGLLNQ